MLVEGGNGGDRPPGHLERLVRSLDRLHGGILLGFAALTLAFVPTFHGSGLAAHLALAGAETVVAAHIVRRGERAGQLVALGACALLAALPPFHEAGDLSGGFALAAVSLSAVRLLTTRPYVATVLGIGVAFAVVQRMSGDHAALLDGWSVFLLAVANTYAAGAFVRALERGAVTTDEVQWNADQQEIRVREQEARDRAVSLARQVLHDDVLTALRSISEPSSVGHEGPARLCSLAVRRVGHLADDQEPEEWPMSIGELLSGIGARSPVPLQVELDLADHMLTAEQSSALDRALTEALRNVARHTDAAGARLRVRADVKGLVVEVSDDGYGIAPGTPQGTGMTESVRGGIAQIGGRVDVISGPVGTVVQIRLPLPIDGPGANEDTTQGGTPNPAAHVYELTLAAVGDVGRLIAAVALPQVAVWVLLGGLYTLETPHPVGGLVILLLDVSLALTAWSRVSRSAPGRGWLVRFSSVLTAVQIVSLMLLPPGGLQDLRSWSLGFGGSILVILCFVVPLRTGASLLVPQAVVVLVAWVLTPALSGGRPPFGSLNAVVNTPLIALALGTMVRRNGRAVVDQRARLLARTSELARIASLRRVASLHLDHTRRTIVPWLRVVAEGGLDLGAPDVRARAAILSLEARDDLHAPGFLDARLRARVSRYRQRGGTVVIRPGFEPGAYQRQVGATLSTLVGTLPGPHRITVSPHPLDPHRTRVVVVPPPRSSELAGRLAPSVQVSGDEFAVVFEFDEAAQ